MSKKRTFSADEKFTAVLDSYTSGNVSEAAVRAGVHINQLSKWRKEFRTQGKDIFKSKKGKNQFTNQTEIERLQRIIGKQAIQIDFLERVHESMN